MTAASSTKDTKPVRILLKSIKFEKPAFRKLQTISLDFAPRITLLSGHNGVGKSTILGMLASTSGLTKTNPFKSYFGKYFEANVSEIVYVDYHSEVEAKKKDGTLNEPVTTYTVGKTEINKVCSLTRRGASPRARIVSRTDPHTAFSQDGVSFGPDAKFPLPTLFLGMARMLPVGESPESRIQSIPPVKWEKFDQDFLADLINEIVPGSNAVSGTVAANRVKLTTKVSSHPKYPHDIKSVSLGQDSLGAIATALASFHRLKRQQKSNYRGGLLIIDELDAGFHPHALKKLAGALQRVAEELSLQIVATTHSPGLIKAIHPDGPFRSRSKGKDAVLYLRNTAKPRHDPAFGLESILNDMDLVPPQLDQPPPVLQVYFEDDEAKEMFERVTPKEFLQTLGAEHGVKIEAMPLGVGCSSLERLPSKDPYFKSVLIVLDADGKQTHNTPPNAVFLPGGVDSIGNGLSPERTMIQFIREIIENEEGHEDLWNAPKINTMSTDNMRELFVNDPSIDITMDRKAAKQWWSTKIDQLQNLKLIEQWARYNEGKVSDYLSALKQAVKVAAKEKRRISRLANSSENS
ncbi:AAA family ATPase [Stenotrophomonas indicatrix]|uniref:AAA family ATPase n=1 Tax=Stenotrophomonas indicatrix TaxID=2045451 RepID=UPI001CBF7FF7|nr:AAA family ATPase [Stenotrophomonas indicatrix]